MNNFDLSKYKNGGRRKETTVFEKSFICGTVLAHVFGGLKRVNVRIDVKIKEIDLATEVIFNYVDGKKKLVKIGNTKKTTNLITVSKYRTLSICGSTADSGGQILDTLRDRTFHAENGFNKKRFLDIWEQHHLNDLQSGTQRQQEELNKWAFRPVGFSYSEDCEYLKKKNLYSDRGYKFGSAWLIEELPSYAEDELKQIIEITI